MHNTFLGIIQNSTDESNFALGIIDSTYQSASSKSVSIEKAFLDEVVSMCSRDVYSADLERVQEFLKTKISNEEKVQTLMEVPAAVLDMDSVHLKPLFFFQGKDMLYLVSASTRNSRKLS